jgi:hypothetical protein
MDVRRDQDPFTVLPSVVGLLTHGPPICLWLNCKVQYYRGTARGTASSALVFLVTVPLSSWKYLAEQAH